MPEPERLPAPSFRLPDGTVATIQHVNNEDGTVKGVRLLPNGRTVRFTSTLENWDKIQKTRIQED
jgi:hypothetical protein